MQRNPMYSVGFDRRATDADPLSGIASRLIELDARDWLSVIALWLARYRGLETFMFYLDEFPERDILACLTQLQLKDCNNKKIAHALARLDFLTYRARNNTDSNDTEHWDSTEVAFNEFYRESHTAVWQSNVEYPAPEKTERWLLDRLEAVRAGAPVAA